VKRDPIALDPEFGVEVVLELRIPRPPSCDGGDTQVGALPLPRVEDAAQDDRSSLVPRRVGTVDAYEGTFLAVDHGTSSEVEPGELDTSPHRFEKLVHVRHETEHAP
jgi:hypothetical protein